MFGKKLRQAREENNVSQKTLADIIGRRNDQISQLERGVRQPSKKEFENICNILNRTPEFFYPEGVPELKETRDNKTYNKFGKSNKPAYGKKDNRTSRFNSSKKMDKTYGQSKRSEEEIKKITEKVTVDGEIFDIEKEIKTVEPVVETATESTNEIIETPTETVATEEISREIKVDASAESVENTNKKISITIPIDNKNITIVIENI